MRAPSGGIRALFAGLLLAGCGGGGGGGTPSDVCPADQVRCGERCVDPLTDRAYCGADASCAGYTACASGQVCGNGSCATSCPPDQVNCGGKCVDPLTDRAYCGADASCAGYTACAPGQVCGNGSCATSCPPDQVNCGGKCVDPLTDRAYCGASATCTGYTRCAQGQVCGDGSCATSCPSGQVSCGGKCVDPLTDRAYCGADASCGGYTSCAPGQVCGNGSCAASCPSGQVSCGGQCIDPASSRAFCNASDTCTGYTSCGLGELCVSRQCQTACPSGQLACGHRCVDPLTDPVYCGAASDCSGATTCGAGSFCDAGRCWSPCDPGQAFCDQRCVDPATSRAFCGAAGLCSGAASGVGCAPDHLCAGGACACPEGQTDCGGVCRFGACGAPAPAWEWNANVALTAAPLFREPSTVIAHIVFDAEQGMVDRTAKTTWTAVSPSAVPPSGEDTLWLPPQPYSGPFTSTAYWIGDEASRDYLALQTSGPFTACARYRGGAFPEWWGTNKVVFSLGKPEYMSATPGAKLGGWALMQMHEATCFHYYDRDGGEWMSPYGFTVDSETVQSMEWIWHCGGWDGTGDGRHNSTDLAVLQNSSYSPWSMENATNPLPITSGFPADLELPSIGAYSDGTAPLSDGQVYEVIITKDPATESNMKALVARAAGGLRLGNTAPVPIEGADGKTHLGPPGTVRVEADGSVIANQSVVLGAVLPAGSNPELHGQCWGVEASATTWDGLHTNGPLLEWLSADGLHSVRVSWSGTWTTVSAATDGAGAGSTGWGHPVYAAGSRHRFHYCVTASGDVAGYVDGVLRGAAGGVLAPASLPHLEDPRSSFVLGNISADVKIWRVFACDSSDPTACP